MDINIDILDTLDCAQGQAYLSHPSSGGICLFIGTVRHCTQNEEVEALHFEAYEAMAKREMRCIAQEAGQKWNLNKVILHHAVGTKKIKDPVVLVGASSAHREDCFAACRYLIDTLKQRVPIWKKEIFKNKSVWVSAHP